MILKRLSSVSFDEVFSIMKHSFPKNEHRPREEQLALLSDNRYSLITYGRDDVTEAFVALWDMWDFYFIEHFAVAQSLRGRGVGSSILKELLSSVDRPVYLEAEPPDEEIAIRRIGFYRRLGFHYCDREYIQPSISDGRDPIPLKLMSYPKPLSDKDFISIRNVIYKEVYHVTDTLGTY